MASLKENISQERAINTIYGPVIIVSCPGSGKTTTLVRRIHRMLEEGIRPENILMVTFGAMAAEDMNKRYSKMYGGNPGICFKTIHALCLDILINEKRLTREEKPLSQRERIDILCEELERFDGAGNVYDMAVSLLPEIDRCRAYDIPAGEFVPSSCEKGTFVKIIGKYEDSKKRIKRIDFEDMLTMCRDLLRTSPEVLEKWQQRYQFIQVDEYQDTSRVQRDILYMLAGDKANLCVVGDDDQSIYRFRGADNSIMMHFEEDFKEKGVQKILMSINYRSAQKIVDMADACIKHNLTRFSKDFISERGRDGVTGEADYRTYSSWDAEMKGVVSKIRQRHADGVAYKDMAILCRTNKQADLPIHILTSENIPFQTTENIMSLYDIWMFSDIKAYTELSMGKDVQRNMQRVLNRPNRYINPEVVKDLEFNTAPMIDAVEYKKKNRDAWKYTATVNAINDWLSTLGPGKITEDTPTEELFRRLCGKGTIQYDNYIRQVAKVRRKDERELMETFEALKADAVRHGTVGKWLAYAERTIERVRIQNRNKSKNKDGVVLTTMHKSKGQEWDTVFIIGATDSVIPGRQFTSREDLEEERRVLYVAMTRAQNALYISAKKDDESRFMTETMKALNEKYAPIVRKKLAGAPVSHRLYGKGKVVGYTQDRIAIRFGGDVKKFVFPDVFVEGHMEYL